MWGTVEDERGSGPTCEREGGEVSRQTEENDEKIVVGHAVVLYILYTV